jgi:hypothetical protein
LVGTARTQFLRAVCFYRGLERIRFKGSPHVYEGTSLFNSLKAYMELALDLIIIGMILPGEPDRRPKLL